MTVEQEITFHGIPHEPELEALVRERIERLPHFYDRIQGCRVVLAAHPPVKVVISVPHHEPIVIAHEPTEDPSAGLSMMVRESFSLAERRLRELHDRRTSKR